MLAHERLDTVQSGIQPFRQNVMPDPASAILPNG
jgi:hypothetical protein